MKNQTKQFRIGLIAAGIISIHVLLCLFFLFGTGRYTRNRIASLYRQLALVGPFFTESRIKSTHYLTIRWKKNNEWSPLRRPCRENFSSYNNLPWRLDNLSAISYEIRLAHTLGTMVKEKSFTEIKKSLAFRELNGYLMDEFVQAPVDCIQIVSGLEHYHPDTRSVTLDTTFIFTYEPLPNAEK